MKTIIAREVTGLRAQTSTDLVQSAGLSLAITDCGAMTITIWLVTVHRGRNT
jgi:hypothetical protein